MFAELCCETWHDMLLLKLKLNLYSLSLNALVTDGLANRSHDHSCSVAVCIADLGLFGCR